MFYLTREAKFAAAHSLRGYDGKCENIHGHTWRVAVTVRGTELDKIGMVLDFTEMKRLIREEIIEPFDHTDLNETFRDRNPTCENIAREVFQRLKRRFQSTNVQLFSVRVWENDTCSAEYREE